MEKEEIIKKVENELPEFVKACKSDKADLIILCQESFTDNEIELLGAAVKYAGYNKKNLTIIAKPE
jgi:hypothetical protein